MDIFCVEVQHPGIKGLVGPRMKPVKVPLLCQSLRGGKTHYLDFIINTDARKFSVAVMN